MSERSESKRAEWTEIIRRREESGLCVARFCREREIPAWKYHYWRRRLSVRSGTEGGFVEVSFSERSHSSGLWFDLPSGIRLMVDRDFDGVELARVLHVVGGGRC
jgi:hypothetical protein